MPSDEKLFDLISCWYIQSCQCFLFSTFKLTQLMFCPFLHCNVESPIGHQVEGQPLFWGICSLMTPYETPIPHSQVLWLLLTCPLFPLSLIIWCILRVCTYIPSQIWDAIGLSVSPLYLSYSILFIPLNLTLPYPQFLYLHGNVEKVALFSVVVYHQTLSSPVSHPAITLMPW